jgi:hypothetical protein
MLMRTMGFAAVYVVAAAGLIAVLFIGVKVGGPMWVWIPLALVVGGLLREVLSRLQRRGARDQG